LQELADTVLADENSPEHVVVDTVKPAFLDSTVVTALARHTRIFYADPKRLSTIPLTSLRRRD